MEGNKYQELAMRTCWIDTISDKLLNGAIGLAGETGEVADIIKKFIYHDKDLSKEDLTLELGDVIWYVSEIASAMGIKLDDILEKNIQKLENRHPKMFDKK